jgi:type I restriction-modification system DNA methylase subunit
MARSTKDPQPARTSARESAPPPSPRSFGGFSEVTSFLWSVADLLRGDYKQADYGKVILPLTVLRRLDCVLARSKAKVLARHEELRKAKQPEGTIEKTLMRLTTVPFYNISKLDFEKLKGDPNHIAANLTGVVRTLYDPAAGTGGMLSVAEEYLRELNPDAELKVFGQELNAESYAICKSDMMIKGQNPENIVRGNSFSEDGQPDGKFDYMLSNPPFGVEWKKVQKEVEEEHEKPSWSCIATGSASTARPSSPPRSPASSTYRRRRHDREATTSTAPRGLEA